MSWSIAATGTKDEVKAAIAAQADGACKYQSPLEADDIKATKERMDRLVDALVVKDGEVVSASGYGSHYNTDGGITNGEFHCYVKSAKPTV